MEGNTSIEDSACVLYGEPEEGAWCSWGDSTPSSLCCLDLAGLWVVGVNSPISDWLTGPYISFTWMLSCDRTEQEPVPSCLPLVLCHQVEVCEALGRLMRIPCLDMSPGCSVCTEASVHGCKASLWCHWAAAAIVRLQEFQVGHNPLELFLNCSRTVFEMPLNCFCLHTTFFFAYVQSWGRSFAFNLADLRKTK